MLKYEEKPIINHILWAHLHHNYIVEGEKLIGKEKTLESNTQQRIFEAQDPFFHEHGLKNRAPCNFQPLEAA